MLRAILDDQKRERGRMVRLRMQRHPALVRCVPLARVSPVRERPHIMLAPHCAPNNALHRASAHDPRGNPGWRHPVEVPFLSHMTAC